jgi:hypothetical protein
MLMATTTREITVAERTWRLLKLLVKVDPLEEAIRSLSMEEMGAAGALKSKEISTLLELNTPS